MGRPWAVSGAVYGAAVGQSVVGSWGEKADERQHVGGFIQHHWCSAMCSHEPPCPAMSRQCSVRGVSHYV